MGYVYQNWECKRQVTLKNGNQMQTLFWTSTQTVNGTFAYSFLWNGQPAYMFPCNELTEDLWNRQCEREILLEWMRAAELQDRTAMAELIVEQTQSGYSPSVDSRPQFTNGAITGWTRSWRNWSRIEILWLRKRLMSIRRREDVLPLSLNMMPPEIYCENIVCDLHFTDMEPAEVWPGHGPVLKTISKGYQCTVKPCTRFFGTEGYSDLTEGGEFATVRTEPSWSRQHDVQPMYIQRTLYCLQWVCPVCRRQHRFQELRGGQQQDD